MRLRVKEWSDSRSTIVQYYQVARLGIVADRAHRADHPSGDVSNSDLIQTNEF